MEPMTLSPGNYHSIEAKQNYMTASRYKDFAGCLGIAGCEARAMAMMRGEWADEPTSAMMVSSYVDHYFAGSLDMFRAVNPGIFTKKGELYAQYKHAETIIARIERDPLFMRYLSGSKQTIMTASMFGCEWSVMIDSLIFDVAIVDLKVMSELHKSYFSPGWGRMDFVRNYGYDIQAAIYQAVVMRSTGASKKTPFYIAAASKEQRPDIEIIGFEHQQHLDDLLYEVENNMPRILAVRDGKAAPDRCGRCDYCRETKTLTNPVDFSTLI